MRNDDIWKRQRHLHSARLVLQLYITMISNIIKGLGRSSTTHHTRRKHKAKDEGPSSQNRATFKHIYHQLPLPSRTKPTRLKLAPSVDLTHDPWIPVSSLTILPLPTDPTRDND